MYPEQQQPRGSKLPNPDTVVQIKNLLELGLLLLALPWILYRLFTDPVGLMRKREGS